MTRLSLKGELTKAIWFAANAGVVQYTDQGMGQDG